MTDRIVIEREGKLWKWTMTASGQDFNGVNSTPELAATDAHHMIRALWWKKNRSKPVTEQALFE